MAEIEFREWLLLALVLIGTLIAWRQHKTARDRLRFELFEKRFAVFEALMQFMTTISVKKSMADEDLYRFLARAQAREFLFGSDVTEYLDDIKTKAKRIDYLQLHQGDPDLAIEDKKKLSKERRTLVVWFGDELRNGSPTKKFAEYLQFWKAT